MQQDINMNQTEIDKFIQEMEQQYKQQLSQITEVFTRLEEKMDEQVIEVIKKSSQTDPDPNKFSDKPSRGKSHSQVRKQLKKPVPIKKVKKAYRRPYSDPFHPLKRLDDFKLKKGLKDYLFTKSFIQYEKSIQKINIDEYCQKIILKLAQQDEILDITPFNAIKFYYHEPLPKLLSQLNDPNTESYKRSKLSKQIIYTYDYYIIPENFLLYLIQQYFSCKKRNNPKEFKDNKFQIINVIDKWIKYRIYDFKIPILNKLFCCFMNYLLKNEQENWIQRKVKTYQILLQDQKCSLLFQEIKQQKTKEQKNLENIPLPPKPIVLFLGFDPKLIAEQLTLIDAQHFKKIEIYEFCNWNKKNAETPNMTAWIESSQKFSKCLKDIYEMETDSILKLAFLQKLMEITIQLEELRNFDRLQYFINTLEIYLPKFQMYDLQKFRGDEKEEISEELDELIEETKKRHLIIDFGEEACLQMEQKFKESTKKAIPRLIRIRSRLFRLSTKICMIDIGNACPMIHKSDLSKFYELLHQSKIYQTRYEHDIKIDKSTHSVLVSQLQESIDQYGKNFRSKKKFKKRNSNRGKTFANIDRKSLQNQ